MKNYSNKYIFSLALLILILACSTKKDNIATRNFQALNTKYNVLYNGGLAFDKGLETVKLQYIDDFWNVLPVERQQPLASDKKDGDTPKNADFEKAELKATKAIQRRSMNIEGTERNSQIDEAYLMLGKSRYNDQRYIPALEAFNYILYKYPKSDKIYDARIWIQKTNMRLDNDNLALLNLTELLGEIKLKNQTFADTNAILAQAFIKTEQNDSAIFALSKAVQYTKINEEKARYRFIKGQLYEKLNQKENAFSTYQEIIDMKRKSPRIYATHAQTRQAMQFDFVKGDTLLFLEKYNKLLLDRENRPYLDILNHQLGLTYDKSKNAKQAKKYYNKSLRCKSNDAYLEASNYRNIADIYFYDAKYIVAGKYYDSTLTKLTPRTREFNFIKKKRENLDDVIKYEGIANTNDSILKVLAMTDSEKNKFYENFIFKIKADEAKQNLADQVAKSKLKIENTKDKNLKSEVPKNDFAINLGTTSNFYFYNQVTVAYGKVEFRKNWGDRTLKNNWRNGAFAPQLEDDTVLDDASQDTNAAAVNKNNTTKIDSNSKYETDFYINKLPTKQEDIAILIRDRNEAYYELGTIYKEKFKEYKLAQNKLETLLDKKPSDKLIVPTMYNLLKIYEITDQEKAIAMRALIIKMFPESRYAQLLINEDQKKSIADSPQLVYNDLFMRYQSGDYRNLSSDLEKYIKDYNGQDILPKIELLKANNIGKLKGLNDYKNALKYVATTYPKVQEGKDAMQFVNNDIVAMEELQFNLEKPLSWKILFAIDCNNDKTVKPLLDKLNKFVSTSTYNKIKTSTDYYTLDQDFIAIHNIKNENQANDIMSILRDYKDYKIEEQGIIISSDNYKIVQIKKNLEEYLCDPKKMPTPVVKKVVEQKMVPEMPAEASKKIDSRARMQKSMSPPGSMQQLDQIDQDDSPVNKQQELKQNKK